MPTQSTREAIYSALFAKFSSIPGVNYASRRMRAFSDIGSDQQPALFQIQAREVADKVTGRPIVWRLYLDIWLYTSTGGDVQNAVPSQVFNPIVDAIESALLPGPLADYYQTLGIAGVVEGRIVGPVETFEGDLSTQALVMVPVEILAL